MTQNMLAPCDNCPFNETGPGRKLRDSLHPGRFLGILDAVANGADFYCHKTVDWDEEDEDEYEGDFYRPKGRERVCAGSLAWLEAQR